MMWTALALTLGSMLAVTTAPSRAAAQELVAAAGAGAGGIGLPPAGAGLVPGTPGIPSAGAGVGPGTFGIPPAGAGIGNGNGGVTRPPGLVPPCCFLPAWVWIDPPPDVLGRPPAARGRRPRRRHEAQHLRP